MLNSYKSEFLKIPFFLLRFPLVQNLVPQIVAQVIVAMIVIVMILPPLNLIERESVQSQRKISADQKRKKFQRKVALNRKKNQSTNQEDEPRVLHPLNLLIPVTKLMENPHLPILVPALIHPRKNQ